jgi:hypothetical protein
MFVIIADMSAMFGIPGIVGIEPDLPAPFMIARGSIVPGLTDPAGGVPPIIDPRLPSGDDFNSCSRLPDAASQSAISPIEPRVASMRPSVLNPASIELPLRVNVRNSRPDFTSHIFSCLSIVPGVRNVELCCLAGSAP